MSVFFCFIFLFFSLICQGDVEVPEQVIPLRDPFKRPELHKEKKEFHDLLGLNPLERFSVNEFKLIGVLTGLRDLKALVLSPDGQTHIVSEKMRIGKNKGSVLKITSDKIYVRESFINSLGEHETINTKIILPSSDKELSVASIENMDSKEVKQ